MIGGGPYRGGVSPTWTEEELWLRLDDACLEALRDPPFAWAIAWNVVIDSTGFPDVRRAAESVLRLLLDHDCTCVIHSSEAAVSGSEEKP